LSRALTLLLLALAACGSDGTHGRDARDLAETAATDGSHDLDAAADDIPDLKPTDRTHDDTPTPVDVQAAVEECKFWLSNAEPVIAAQCFTDVLALVPDSLDARFGLALSRYVNATEIAAMLLTLPTQYGAYVSGEGTALKPESENDYLVEEVHAAFLKLRNGFLDADAQFAQITDPAFSWDIEQVPIYVLTRPIMNLRGRFDLADVHLLRSYCGFFLWTFELITAQDLHTDFLTAVYKAREMRDAGKIEIPQLLALLSNLMAADPQFLELRPDDGNELFGAGNAHMVQVGQELLAAIDWLVENEPDPPDGDVSVLTWSGPDVVLTVRNQVPDFGTLEVPLTIAFTPDMLEASRTLASAMHEPGAALPFSQSLAVQLGTALSMLSKLGLFDLLPVNIPIDVSDLEPGQVTSLLAVMFADSIAFDWGTFFAHPVGLRTLLPLLIKDPDSTGPEGTWMEWECPAETADTGFPLKAAGFLCSKDADLIDAPHFLGTTYELAGDGLASPLPYMVWTDPAWGGLLLVDDQFVEGSTDHHFVSPDLALTNLGIHQWLLQVVGLAR
jgi:hypothetical protein